MDLDTAIDESGLIPKHIMDDAKLSAFSSWQDRESNDEWMSDIRHEFSSALDAGRPEFAAALVFEALTYAFSNKDESDLLYLQGIALTKMLQAGDTAELHDYRIRAFENALNALLQDRGWTHAEILCRTALAHARLDAGKAKAEAKMLAAASDEFDALIPALRDGRLGFTQHAKAAELAALLAQAKEALAEHETADIDPLYYWINALKLALDPQRRSDDTLGYWDAAMELIEPWIEQLSEHKDAKTACSKVRDVLVALELPSENPDYGWVQHFIGKLSLAAGLQSDGLRTEAKNIDDEAELLQSVAASRMALVAVEAEDNQGWLSTAFQLAYALHSLAEKRCDIAHLDDAIGYYQQVANRLAGLDGMEEELYLAQVRMNLSEAMALKGELTGDAALARSALDIATDAHLAFTLWAHDEGIEVAQANCARISATIDAIENQ